MSLKTKIPPTTNLKSFNKPHRFQRMKKTATWSPATMKQTRAKKTLTSQLTTQLKKLNPSLMKSQLLISQTKSKIRNKTRPTKFKSPLNLKTQA